MRAYYRAASTITDYLIFQRLYQFDELQFLKCFPASTAQALQLQGVVPIHEQTLYALLIISMDCHYVVVGNLQTSIIDIYIDLEWLPGLRKEQALK